MTKKNKIIITLLSTIIILSLLMIGLIYFDYNSNREVSTKEEVVKEDINDEYKEIDIPNLTEGDSIEEIEQDLESLNLEDLESNFEEIEKEIEELL